MMARPETVDPRQRIIGVEMGMRGMARPSLPSLRHSMVSFH